MLIISGKGHTACVRNPMAARFIIAIGTVTSTVKITINFMIEIRVMTT